MEGSGWRRRRIEDAGNDGDGRKYGEGTDG